MKIVLIQNIRFTSLSPSPSSTSSTSPQLRSRRFFWMSGCCCYFPVVTKQINSPDDQGHCVLSVFQYEFISKETLNTNILYSVVIFTWLHVISHKRNISNSLPHRSRRYRCNLKDRSAASAQKRQQKA